MKDVSPGQDISLTPLMIKAPHFRLSEPQELGVCVARWNPYLGKLGKLAPGRPRCPFLLDRCSHCRSLQAEEVWAWDAGRDYYHGILSDLVKSVTSEPTWQCTEWELWGCRKDQIGSEPLCSQSKWRVSRTYWVLGGLGGPSTGAERNRN